MSSAVSAGVRSKPYALLVFADISPLMHGVTDIVRAFRLRMALDLG
jgi:hypothetical protein